jgi:predicted phage terminase large subunit-like protein
VPQEPGERYKDYRRRTKHLWGLVETVHDACFRFGVNELLVENKASGLSLIQTVERLFPRRRYQIHKVDPQKLDKVARMHRVEGEFARGQIYVPYKDGEPLAWAEMVVHECATAPRGRYDDLLDSTTYAIFHLRSIGQLEHRDEMFLRKEDMGRNYKALPPLYNI